MNYKKNYYDFISSRKNMNREKLDGNIYELHHILPRSLGGLDNKENLILLTPREHFLAHIMLYKIYGRGPMLRALFIMLSSVNNKEKKISSRVYERIKKEYLSEVSRPVICLETLKIFSSRTEAALFVGKTIKGGQDINNAIKIGDGRRCGGYHWADYDKSINYLDNKWYNYNKNDYYVLVRLEDAKKYKTYKEACADNNCTVGAIGWSIRQQKKGEKIKGTAKGFHFAKWKPFIDYTNNEFYGKKPDNMLNKKKFICEDTKETYKSMSEICKKYKKSQGCASIELKKNGFVMIDNNKFRRINLGE